MICIKDNTLSKEEIKKLLVFTTHPHEKWAGCVNCAGFGIGESQTVNINFDHPLINKIINQSVEKNKFKEVEWAKIISYPTGSSMSFHLDTSRETTTGASITFLNDDFVGGEAIVEGIKISPLAGRTYYFDGKIYKHAVLNVIKGIRHTLSIWYKNG